MPKIPDPADFASQLPESPEHYFVAFQRDPMLVVRHADGVPMLTIGGDGKAVPYVTPAPSGETVTGSLSVPSGPAKIA